MAQNATVIPRESESEGKPSGTESGDVNSKLRRTPATAYVNGLTVMTQEIQPAEPEAPAREAIKELRKLARHSDPLTSLLALRKLSAHDHPLVVDVLIDTLESERVETYRVVRQVMASFTRPETLEYLHHVVGKWR